MVIITFLLLALLFIAGLLSTLYSFPNKKFMIWLQSLAIKTPPHVPNNPVMSPKKVQNGSGSKEELRSVFATFDKNSDGFISKLELRESLENIGILVTEREVEDMVEKVDSNGDGVIDPDEFSELFESTVAQEEASGEEGGEKDEGEADLKEAFNVFDGDRDGLITVEELRLVLSSMGLKEGKSWENCKKMIRKVDMDGDGMVNFDEFKRMMKANQSLVPAF